MKYNLRVAGTVLLALALLGDSTAAGRSPSIRVSLSLDENPIVVTRHALRAAERSIDVALYKFDEGSLRKELKASLKRGVTVRVLADADEAKRGRSELDRIGGAQIRLWKPGKLHAKFVVVDQRRVLTGSFNWTESAQHDNVELILALDDLATVQSFRTAFERLWQAGSSR